MTGKHYEKEKVAEFRNRIARLFEQKFNDEKSIVNFERGILNYTVNRAKELGIVRKWGNPEFLQIYLAKVKTMLGNLASQHGSVLLKKVKDGEMQHRT